MMKRSLCLLFLLVQVAFVFSQQTVSLGHPQKMEWQIGNDTRSALVYIPEKANTKPVPVIFAFHGHGGSMYNVYRTRRFDQLWSDAIFICPQGMNTPGKLTDPEGKRSGWKMDIQDSTNRDLIFFDAMVQTLCTTYQVDMRRIYATGHSNGGGFTYLLWAVRGHLLAAVAPTATSVGRLAGQLEPKPAFHLMGEADPLVKPEWQRATCRRILRINSCEAEGEKLGEYSTRYPSATSNPVVLFVHPGGHEYPAVANEAIIEFFKTIP